MADVYWSSVVLLLHCDGSDASTTFTDSSLSGHTVNVGGNAQLDTAQKKFGTASALFDGTGDYLLLDGSTDFIFAAGDFTVEFWLRINATGANQNLYDCRPSGANGAYPNLYVNTANKIAYYVDEADRIVSTTALSTGQWYHVALSRGSGTTKLFIDGTQEGSSWSDSTTYIVASNRPAIGIALDLSAAPLNGWIDDLRVTKGVARYTSTFTAPTEAFPDSGETTGTGALAAQSATIAGSGTAISLLTGTGALAAQSATIVGVGVINGVEISLPISMNVMLPVVVGLPIRIDIYTAVTPTLPIVIGPYPVTPTLPITFKTPVVASLPTLPITFPGAYSAVASALLIWTPKCVLDGVDISAGLIGAQDIEFEESAAPVATFSFIPAAGTVDPLMYVGKAVSLSISIGTATYLAFKGVVSDPEWNAGDRTITVSATGDLQSKLDATTKTAILAQLGGAFSEHVFGSIEDMSGWEYAEALVSTQPVVIWQDANSMIRTTSILAKAAADYTFTASDILDTAQVVRWAGRMDFINKLNVSLDYRFQRRRERRLTFNFRPWQLETPSTYLSGNEGGWDLPQRSQIASAADGGGWTVIGDITYTDVWPNGYYSTYSDAGTPMMEGLSITPEVAAELCIAAKWTGAKRWLQTVTERYTMTVTASDSIAAVGTLATDESYAIEDEATDEAWESSLEFDDYVSGATLMANGIDKKADLDSIRADVTTAMGVSLSKAQNDILKSHRGTTVGFQTTYDPRLDLSHTLAVDTTYLDCKGKIRRLAHHWDIDTGDATTEVEIALSRHNGSGLASSDTLTPPSEPADKTEPAPSTYHQLLMHIGGQTTQPDWDETWDGYIVNMPFSAAAGSATILGSWARNPANPDMKDKTYEEGFHVLAPEVAADYADPAEVTGAASYDVEIPQDTLTLISG